MAAAIFVAVLFVATLRVQKLYAPTRLMVMDDQTRSVLSAWCGAFLILASGVFTWGVSHDLSRGDILLFWAIGAVALLGHRAFWRTALPRALESGALRGRTRSQLLPARTARSRVSWITLRGTATTSSPIFTSPPEKPPRIK